MAIVLMAASLIGPQQLTCVEVRHFLPGGSSRPLLAGALDEAGNFQVIVLKLRHPPVADGQPHYAGTSLACELICAVLARAVGLDVPDYSVVALPAGLAESVPDPRLRELLRHNPDRHFGLRFLEGIAEGPPGRSASLAALDRLEDVLAFDATVINGDRKAMKPNLLRQGDRIIVIDHGVAIPVHLAADDVIDSSPLFPESQVRDHCAFGVLEGSGRAYNRMLARWTAELDDAQWTELRAMIPASWERRPGDLDRIFRFLHNRGERARDISTDLLRVMR